MQKITLAAARVNKRMTQAYAAKELGVSVSTIKNWEKGVTFPKQPQIEKICALYGVPFDYLCFIVG